MHTRTLLKFKCINENVQRLYGLSPTRGVDFVKWVCVLIKDTESSVSYCGWLSGLFALESGIRQGCPFSPLPIFLAVELLAIKIKDCKDIKRIRNWSAVNNITMESVVKIALYADHITLFLQNENEILLAVISLTVSGLSTICSPAVKLSQHGRSSRGALLLVNMKCIRKA